MKIYAKKNLRVIGFSATTYAFPSTLELAETIRFSFPDKLVLLGGSHANVPGAETINKYSAFDVDVSGLDGEYTALEIIE